MRSLRVLLVLVLLSLGAGTAFSQNPVNVNLERGRAKAILKNIAKEIEKNFYDEGMNGLDWQALVAEANQKMEKAQTVNQLYLAIFVLVDKLDDSHTIFAPPGRAARPLFGFKAKTYGDAIYVYEVKPKGAAEASGLRAGDRILKVNGFTPTRRNFQKMMLFYRVLQPVARFDLLVQRGAEAPQTITVNAKIKRESSRLDLTKDFNFWQLLLDAENENNEERTSYLTPQADGIGMLRLRDFGYGSHRILEIFSLVEKSKGVVIDLRGNPGGRLETLTAFAGKFSTEAGVLADVITRKKSEPVKLKPHSKPYTSPLVVLVDSESASASEMFARFVQLKKKGIVIGDRTAGAVTASIFYPGEIGADSVVFYGVQVGTGKVIFPGNEVLEKKGVTPDRMCVPTQEHLAKGLDPCLAMAREYLMEQLKASAQAE